MKKSKLGNSDLQVSQISFGCMSLPKESSQNTKLIQSAYEKGINFFDTADRYDHGWNEKILGEAVQDFRKDILISTKVGHKLSGEGSGWKWAPTKEHILSAVDHSLRRLQTDWIDLYQLHGGTLEDPIDDIIEAFHILQEAGKIRYYGISSIRPNVIRKYVDISNISSVMMQYSLLDRRPEEECFDLLETNNIGVLARGTLAQGLLVNKPPTETLGYSEGEVLKLQTELRKKNNPISGALHFVLENPAVSTAVVGMKNEEQLDGIINGYSYERNPKYLSHLKEVLEPKHYELHRS